jgi:hypothetical protein
MSLAPVPDALGVVSVQEVMAVGGFGQPAALAGPFAGLAAGGFAAVMLAVPVAVIGEEKLAATAALTSLRSRTHRESKPSRPRSELKPNATGQEGPGAKKEEGIGREVAEENPGEEEGISNRRIYTTFIPPLTSTNRPLKPDVKEIRDVRVRHIIVIGRIGNDSV